MSIDSQRVGNVVPQLRWLWTTPVSVALSLYFLWGLLGPSCLTGLAVLLLMIPINAVFAIGLKVVNNANMKKKDAR